MSIPNDEVISQFLDELNANRNAPVEAFLAKFPDLDATTKSGLAKMLQALAVNADTARSVGAESDSWIRLEALLDQAAETTAAKGGLENAPILAPMVAPPTAQQDRPGRIYTRPIAPIATAQAPRAWLGPLVALAGAVAVVALFVWLRGTQIATNPAKLTPEPTVTTAVAATPYKIAVDTLVADNNLIELGVSAYDPTTPDNAQQLGASAEATLYGPTGLILPRIDGGMYTSWTATELSGKVMQGQPLIFDASSLNNSATTLDLRLTLTVTVPSSSGFSSGSTAAPQPVSTSAVYFSFVQISMERVLHVRFDPRRRIATPNLTTSGRGVAATLRRVVATASESRFYFDPGPSVELRLPQLQTGAQQIPDGGWRQMNGLVSMTDANGLYVLRLTGDLLDKPSPWTLTLPEETREGLAGPPAGATPTWMGPWIFYFAMPDVSTSLTPGALPTAPPATARPTDLPGAVPTFTGPFSGPVPPTQTASPDEINKAASQTPPPTTTPIRPVDIKPTETFAPTPTAISDLTTLTQRADVIVRANLVWQEPSVGMDNTYQGVVTQWIKRPTDWTKSDFYVNTQMETATGGRTAAAFANHRGTADLVLFLNEPAGGSANNASLELVDPQASGFAVENDQIVDAGIALYNGWNAEKFINAIQALAPTPAPLPSDLTATAVAPTPAPSSAPDTATPFPTSTTSLATLVQQSDFIVRANLSKLEPTTSHEDIFRADVTQWLKRPANFVTDHFYFYFAKGSDNEIPEPAALQRVPGGDGPATAASSDEVVFLKGQPHWSSYDAPALELTADNAVFAIEGDKIVDAGLAQYNGWLPDQFLQQIKFAAPELVSIPPSVLALSNMGQKSVVVAEVEWSKTTPQEVNTAEGKRLLLSLKVTQWFKGQESPQQEFLSLELNQDEYGFLSKGSEYVLFLSYGQGGLGCPSYLNPSFYALAIGLDGVLEINGDQIGRSGVSDYQGAAVQQLFQDLQTAVPTPLPGPAPEGYLSMPDMMKSVAYIAEAELTGQQKEGVTPNRIFEYFTVQKWLKYPPGNAPTNLTIVDVTIGDEECQWLAGAGPYVLFFNNNKVGPPLTPEPGQYMLLSMYGLRDDAVEYGSDRSYWGWTLDRFEQAIRAALP